MKRLSSIDTLLIALVLAVTVARGGHVIAAWEQPGLGWVGYLAAIAIDLLILRFAYAWRRSSWGGTPWRLRLVAFVAFAAWSGGVQWQYMRANSAGWWEALLLSAIWPLAIVALAVNEGMTRREERQPDTAERATIPVARVLPLAHAQLAPHSTDRRQHALALAQRGMPARAISAETKTPLRTVYRWIKEKDGASQ
jgi:hypothetical protein